MACLKINVEYVLNIGDPNIPTPNYYLINFQENIPPQLTRVGLSELKIFTKQQNQTTTTIFTNKIVIWVAIVLVVILLGFMSVKLIKETNATKAD